MPIYICFLCLVPRNTCYSYCTIYLPLHKSSFLIEIPLFLIVFLGSIFSMMEGGKSHHLFQDSWFQFEDQVKNNIIDDHDERCTISSSATSSIGQDSDASNGSSIASSDTADDASSSSSLNSSSSGALYDLSEIMDQLPIKRGLSKFYKGKSESFTSLARVTSIEDLVKKATPYRRNLKPSRSCGTGFHSYKQYTLPKAIISKKATKGVSLSSFPSKRGSFMNTKPPLTPLYQDLEC